MKTCRVEPVFALADISSEGQVWPTVQRVARVVFSYSGAVCLSAASWAQALMATLARDARESRTRADDARWWREAGQLYTLQPQALAASALVPTSGTRRGRRSTRGTVAGALGERRRKAREAHRNKILRGAARRGLGAGIPAGAGQQQASGTHDSGGQAGAVGAVSGAAGAGLLGKAWQALRSVEIVI